MLAVGTRIKLLDMGLARTSRGDHFVNKGYYVQTVYYRAPEVILRLPYTTKYVRRVRVIGVIVGEGVVGTWVLM